MELLTKIPLTVRYWMLIICISVDKISNIVYFSLSPNVIDQPERAWSSELVAFTLGVK